MDEFGRSADLIICLDADTVLPRNAVGDWEKEFIADPDTESNGVRALPLGGSSSKFTMRGGDFLTRLQRAEFSRWTDSEAAT